MELYVLERGSEIEEIERQETLTSSHCGFCDGILISPSSSESCCDSDGVLCSLLQTSQCVHCLTTSDVRDGIQASETVSCRVGDGV